MTQVANTDHVKAAIEQRNQQQEAQAPTVYRRVETMLEKMRPQFETALPRVGISVERFNRIILNTMKSNPGLMHETLNIHSFFAAVMQCAALGLEPGILGQAHLIPYKDNKNNITTVQMQIGYRGLIDLVSRSGQVLFVDAGIVYKGDTFRAIKGTNQELYHEQNWESEEITHVYAYAKLANGETVFRVMSVGAINKIRDKYSKAYQYDQTGSIWAKHYEAMSLKTVLKQLVKFLPISTSIQEQIALDGTAKDNLEAEPHYIDIEAMEPTAEGGEPLAHS